MKDLKSDRETTQRLVDRVLDNPDLYPDEFKTFLTHWLSGNLNLGITAQQLPLVESPKYVGVAGNAQFAGTWVNFGGTNESAHYYKDPWGRVFVGGVVKLGTIGTTIFTLPVGYRPKENVGFAVNSNGAFGVCTINPDGTVVATSGSNVYFILSGINFRQFS